MSVNVLLRAFSIIIALVLAHQLFFSKGGSKRHNALGKVAVLIGAVLVVLVVIRGARHETMATFYIVHLIVGGSFFAGLFATGFFGWKADRTGEGIVLHRCFARITGFLLLLTLVVGVAAVRLAGN